MCTGQQDTDDSLLEIASSTCSFSKKILGCKILCGKYPYVLSRCTIHVTASNICSAAEALCEAMRFTLIATASYTAWLCKHYVAQHCMMDGDTTRCWFQVQTHEPHHKSSCMLKVAYQAKSLPKRLCSCMTLL